MTEKIRLKAHIIRLGHEDVEIEIEMDPNDPSKLFTTEINIDEVPKNLRKYGQPILLVEDYSRPGHNFKIVQRPLCYTDEYFEAQKEMEELIKKL